MISEETKQKFEYIFRNMTPDQRATLQAHLMTATEEQRWAMIEKIVATYEAKQNNPFVQSDFAPVREVAYEPVEEIPYDEDDETAEPVHTAPVVRDKERFVLDLQSFFSTYKQEL